MSARSEPSRRRGPGNLDAAAAVAATAAGDVSPDELLSDARARAEAWEPWLGAIVRYVERPSEVTGSLRGVVFGLKDIIAVAGIPRGCGAPEAVDLEPQPADATVVKSVIGEGASLLATVETHPLAFGVTTPQTRNPRAPDRVAGGSSGGAAAALATGSVHVALGTDSGGSVRGPASCCGVVGLKTTRGLVPLTGVQSLAWSLDTVGPMALTVPDLALALAALVRFDPHDPVSVDDPALLPEPRLPLRVGVPRELEAFPMDSDVRAAWRSLLDDLDAEGHVVTEVKLPSLPDIPPANGLVLCAEAAAVHRGLLEAGLVGVPPGVAERLRWGAQLLASDVAEARWRGVRFSAELRSAMRAVDALCTPTLACRVPGVDEHEIVVGGERMPTTLALTKLTNPWNLSGVPAGTVPVGRDENGAPIGVQFVASWWGERKVLAAMALTEQMRGGPWPAEAAPPDAAEAAPERDSRQVRG